MPIVYKNVFLYFLLSSAQILTGVRTWCTDIGEFSERCNSRYTTSMSYWAPKETTRGNSQDAASSLYTERMRYIFDTLVNGYFPILTYRMLSNINTERGVYRCVDGIFRLCCTRFIFCIFLVVDGESLVSTWLRGFSSRVSLKCCHDVWNSRFLSMPSVYHQPTKEKENTFLTLYAKSNTCRSFSNLNISILCSNACALYRPKKMYTCNAIRLRERLTPST